MIEKDLSFALFITRDEFGTPRSKFEEFFPAPHSKFLPKKPAVGNAAELSRAAWDVV
jgi:hypothetical protein